MDISHDSNHAFEKKVRLIMSCSRTFHAQGHGVMIIALLTQPNRQSTASPGQVALTAAECSVSTLGGRVPGTWFGQYNQSIHMFWMRLRVAVR